MKSPMPWFYLLAAANASLGFADDGVDAYRQGDYMQAAQQMTAPAGNDPVADYYLGRMRLYGYGQLKNDTLAMRHFQQAGERGYLPAIRIMARYALLVQKIQSRHCIGSKKPRIKMTHADKCIVQLLIYLVWA